MSSTQALAPTAKRRFPQRYALWTSRGLSVRAASAVAAAGCDTIADVARLGRDYFELTRNCGPKTLQELALLASWPPRTNTAADAIAAALSLSVSDPEEAREMAEDVIIALRRSGFLISTSSAPGGSR